MAVLNDTQRREVRADVMRAWSRSRRNVPMTKDELLTLIGFVDVEADASDTAVIQRIPIEHPARAWLIANQGIARRLKALIETKRAEVL